jgi:hypothetical protein
LTTPAGSGDAAAVVAVLPELEVPSGCLARDESYVPAALGRRAPHRCSTRMLQPRTIGLIEAVHHLHLPRSVGPVGRFKAVLSYAEIQGAVSELDMDESDMEELHGFLERSEIELVEDIDPATAAGSEVEFDDLGFPIQENGPSTTISGLHFMGVHFQRKRKSATFLGVAEDAAVLAETLVASNRST